MICPNCRKQIADDSVTCPLCAHRIDHVAQVPREISARRYQRWFFYGLISFLFLGMIVTIAKIYDVNSELMTNMATAQANYKKKAEDLDLAKSQLATSSTKLIELEKNLTEAQKEIAAKTDSYKEILSEKKNLEARYESEIGSKDSIAKGIAECERKLTETDAMIYAMIVSLGMGVSNDNIKKIQVADANLGGVDGDSDGLSDMLEIALGTDKAKKDTDSDGFDDKREVLGGFNPGGSGNLALDSNFANSQKGRILLQVERNGEAWYVNPADGKRYFLGRPGDALKVLASLK